MTNIVNNALLLSSDTAVVYLFLHDIASALEHCSWKSQIQNRNSDWIQIAWLSLNFILDTSWVALYSVVCEWVCQASVSPDQISTFSNIYRHTSPMLTLYHVIPSSASFYWLSTTKYQTVSPYTDPVPAGTTYNSSFRKAQLNNFSFYDSFDESRTVYLV